MLALLPLVLVMGADVPSPQAKSEHARVNFISQTTALYPGQRTLLALDVSIDPGWHIYWPGQNDSGTCLRIMEKKLPAGFELGDIRWPVPHRHVNPGDLLDHVLTDRVALLLPLTVPADAKIGEQATLTLDLEWLECREMCLFGSGQVSLTLPVVAKPEQAPPSSEASRITEAQNALPKPAPREKTLIAIKDAVLTITAANASRLEFYPDAGSTPLADRLKQAVADGDTLRMNLQPEAGSAPQGAGVLAVTWTGQKKPDYYEITTAPLAVSP